MEEQIAANKRNSFILVGIVSIVLVSLGYVFAQIYDPSLIFLFLVIAVVLSTLCTIASYWYSDKIVLSVTKTREPKHLRMSIFRMLLKVLRSQQEFLHHVL